MLSLAKRLNNFFFCTFASLLLASVCGGEDISNAEISDNHKQKAIQLVNNFEKQIHPLLEYYCFDCHNQDYSEADVKLDGLDPDMIRGHDAEKWHAALDMINSGEMPPDDSEQPNNEERALIVEWINISLDASRESRVNDNKPRLRRLTKKQYANTLRDLLLLPIDFGSEIPSDSPSSLGFRNCSTSQQTTALHFQYYESTAREAINKAIVKGNQPESFRVRATLGLNKGADGHAAEIGGFQSMPISSDHVLVEVLNEEGQPKSAATLEGKEELFQIVQNIGVGMRGSSNDRFRVVNDGIILDSALPHKEVSPKTWQGPSPNLKLLIRNQAPTSGPFRLSIIASQTENIEDIPRGILSLRGTSPAVQIEKLQSQIGEPQRIALAANDFKKNQNVFQQDGILMAKDITKNCKARLQLDINQTGIYQIDLVHPIGSEAAMPSISLRIDDSSEHVRLEKTEQDKGKELKITSVAHANLEEGTHSLQIGGRFFCGLSHLVFTKLPEDHPTFKELNNSTRHNKDKYVNAKPYLRTFVGNRTDDGMEYSTFGSSVAVDNKEMSESTYDFFDYLENLPVPTYDSLEPGDLSNIMIVGMWNDHLVKNRRDKGPPLLIKQIEFETPYYPSWPPPSHKAIFFDDAIRDINIKDYTRQVIQQFMERAFRRKVKTEEVDRYFQFWLEIRDDFDCYEDGVGETLVAVLCSPSFLYLDQSSEEPNSSHQLATDLSYFLWNSPPDEWLLQLVRNDTLETKLEETVNRMLLDKKAMRFAEIFAEEWLRLDRHESMKINPQIFPDYSRFVKEDMRKETLLFFHNALSNNLSARVLIDSDFAFLNQNLAEFYGLSGVSGSHFQPVLISAESGRGGLLSQGAFLAGHSDGNHSHPIKRAVWLKEKILGTPPPPPPPNVPELDPDTPGFEKLTLKEQLELHRNKASCVDCHKKIDPYGIAFEEYDAVGRLRNEAKGKPIDKTATLPDGAEVSGVAELKQYILKENYDLFLSSLCEHLFAYATGREITYLDQPEIDRLVASAEQDDRLGSIILQIVKSDTFLRKQ